MEAKIYVKVRKQATSHIITIPSTLVDVMGYKEGDLLLMTLKRADERADEKNKEVQDVQEADCKEEPKTIQ